MGGSFLQIIDRKDDACGLKQLKRAKERRRKREHCVCDVGGSLESNFFRMDRVIASKSSKSSSKESRSSYKGNARREDGGEERVIRADHYRCRWTGHESRRRDIRSNSNDNRGVEAENLSCPRNNRARKIFAEKKKLQRLVPGLDFDCSTGRREPGRRASSSSSSFSSSFRNLVVIAFSTLPSVLSSSTDSFEPSFFPILFLFSSPTEERKTGIPRSF